MVRCIQEERNGRYVMVQVFFNQTLTMFVEDVYELKYEQIVRKLRVEEVLGKRGRRDVWIGQF